MYAEQKMKHRKEETRRDEKRQKPDNDNDNYLNTELYKETHGRWDAG